MVGGAGHRTPFAASARYLLADYLKPAGPVERSFAMDVTLARRFGGPLAFDAPSPPPLGQVGIHKWGFAHGAWR
ncbi:hypothetical protein GCM10010104_58780 [Streptomyces indiaensis]|uniref:Uncharacterized protein n=1 Tax=Streptomyces indiaensis TaxID=284033 RepID=A0ABN3ECL5_9ACTN